MKIKRLLREQFLLPEHETLPDHQQLVHSQDFHSANWLTRSDEVTRSGSVCFSDVRDKLFKEQPEGIMKSNLEDSGKMNSRMENIDLLAFGIPEILEAKFELARTQFEETTTAISKTLHSGLSCDSQVKKHSNDDKNSKLRDPVDLSFALPLGTFKVEGLSDFSVQAGVSVGEQSVPLGQGAEKQPDHRKSSDTLSQRNNYKKEGQARKGRQVYLEDYNMAEKAASDFSEKMPQRNLTLWDTMAKGPAHDGLGEEEIDLFTKFKNLGLKLEVSMFNTIYYACGVIGAVNELGMLHFKSMAMDFGISTSMENFSSMVDICGSCEYLNEAFELTKKIYKIFSRINGLCSQGWVSLNEGQLQYLSQIRNSSSLIFSATAPVAPIASRANLVQVDEDAVLLDSKISQITDLFPDYSGGFLKACLEVYNHDTEEVIQRILEGTLHEDLLSLDSSVEKTSSNQIAPGVNDKGKAVLVEPSASCLLRSSRAGIGFFCDEGQGQLSNDFFEGGDLATIHSSGYFDPYVAFTCHGQTKTSSIKFQTLDPHWNELSEFDVMDDLSSIRDIKVFDFDEPFHEANSLDHDDINFRQPNSNRILMFLPTRTHGGLMEQGLLVFDVMPMKSGAPKLGELTFPPKPGWRMVLLHNF